MKTQTIYKDNVYLKNLNGRITGIYSIDDRTLLTFDRTIFFPTGGGQSHDIGKIIWKSKEIPVVDVYEKEGEIYHQVILDSLYNSDCEIENRTKNTDSFSKGDDIQLQIDWNHRFDNMQRHCGEHILSGAFYKLYKGINRGFHMGKDYMTIDISLEVSPFDKITWKMAKEAELETNKVIWENLPVITTHYDTKEEASVEPLRKELKISSDITIVRIGSFNEPSDAVACCGTHPSHSGQVGMLKIYKIEPNKGMTRIYFDAGKRAFKNYQRDYDVLTKINNKLSAGTEDLLDKFKSMEEHTHGVKARLHNLEKILINSKVKALKPDLEAITGGVLIKTYDDISKDMIQSIGRQLTKNHSLPDEVLLILSSSPGAFAILYASPSSKYHCGNIVKEKGRPIGGKGGGNQTSAQVTFETSNELNNFLGYLKTL